jgi:hypothetical protein
VACAASLVSDHYLVVVDVAKLGMLVSASAPCTRHIKPAALPAWTEIRNELRKLYLERDAATLQLCRGRLLALLDAKEVTAFVPPAVLRRVIRLAVVQMSPLNDTAEGNTEHAHSYVLMLWGLVASLVAATTAFTLHAMLTDTDATAPTRAADFGAAAVHLHAEGGVTPIHEALALDQPERVRRIALSRAVLASGVVDCLQRGLVPSERPDCYLTPYFREVDRLLSSQPGGKRVLPFGATCATELPPMNSDDTRLVALPIAIEVGCDDFDGSAAFQFSVIMIDLASHVITWHGPNEHDQGVVRSVQVTEQRLRLS